MRYAVIFRTWKGKKIRVDNRSPNKVEAQKRACASLSQKLRCKVPSDAIWIEDVKRVKKEFD